jgi:5'-nucleotidase
MRSILISNDDGIGGPGLLPLKQALDAVGDVTVIVPDRQRSASGHAKTMHKPLRVQEIKLADGSAGYSSTGAPSDCVALAVLGFVPTPPDVVISGINLGGNVGHDITYSGTLAAAFEGTISGIPSIAASLDTYEDGDFTYAARFVASLAAEVLTRGLPKNVLLNVNVPNVPEREIAGVEITRLGKRLYRDQLIRRKDPRGRDYYWIGGERPTGRVDDEGTDIWALASNRVSITPIHLDMTDYRFAEELKAWDVVSEGASA